MSNPTPLFSYSRSKGLFAGISLEGTVLVERKETNKDFYGQPIPAVDLLTGKVPAPEAASAMYEVVEAAEMVDESGLPQEAYVPGQPASAPVAGYDVGSTQSQGQPPNKPIFDA